MIKWSNLISQFHWIKHNWTKSPNRVVSSPRNFNFSQIIKLIKLIHIEQFYIVSQQKPIDQFPKKRLKSTKIPNYHSFEILPKMHKKKKCMKHENKWKRRGKKVLPALKDKNPWRNLGKNDKNLAWNLKPIE